MNLEPMLNHLWELSHDAKQYSDLVNLCQKEAINNLPQRIVFNTKEILRHLCSECLVATYHELRTEGKLNRRTREERVQLLDREYLQNKGFVQYFLNKYPVIRDAAYNTVHDYVALCTGVVRSYYDNMYTISDALGNRYGSILDISLPSGDLHNGKAVCIVTFEKGKLVYKPRDRETDQIIENFISNLILPGLPHSLSFRFPKGCQCKNNSWQEFIEYAQCDNMEQVHNFYYRAGIYLATFYVFSSCDMHYDNMISCGEYPFFFDVETLVTGRMNNDMILPKSINNSILSTNVLPISVDSVALDINMSALFTGRHQSKRVVQYTIVPDKEMDWVFEKKYVVVESKNNRVLCSGEEVGSKDVEADIIAGFSDALHVVIRRKSDFISFAKSIDSCVKIRQVIRPTQVYAQFISACRNPEYACDYRKVDFVLDILSKNFTPSAHGYLRVEQEQDDIRRGYVPAFFVEYGGTDLFTYDENRIVCPKYFSYSPRDIVIKKLNYLDEDLINYQIRLISLSLLTTCNVGELHGRTLYPAKKTQVQLNESNILEILAKYVDYISNNIIFFDKDQCTMAMPIVKEEGFAIHSIDFGLYDSGGIIWLLAVYDYYFNLGLTPYIDGLLNALISKYTVSQPTTNQQNMYSISNGLSGFLYVTFNVAQLRNSRHLYDVCRVLIDDIIKRHSTLPKTSELFDFLGGVPGSIYVLCKIFLADNKFISRDELVELCNRFMLCIQNVDVTTLETGFAHGRIGLSVALAGMYEVTKEKGYIELIKKIFPASWDSLESTGWCRGKTGWILASHLISMHTHNVIDFCKDGPNSVEYKKLLLCDNASLCHGFWGTIDVMNTLGYSDMLKQEELRTLQFETLSEVRFLESSKYCYESFMAGASGVAYALLHLIRDVPSVLSFDIFPNNER